MAYQNTGRAIVFRERQNTKVLLWDWYSSIAQPEKKFGFIDQIIVRDYIRTVTFTGVQQYKPLFKMDTSNPTGQEDKPVGSAKVNTSCRMADTPPKNDHRFL